MSKPRTGFTLVELILALALIGVIGAAMLPKLIPPPGTLPRERVSTTEAYDILIDLGFTDEEAMQFLLDNGWLP